MVHELLESHLSVFVLNYKSVPQGPGFAQIFGFGGHDGVWEGHEGQGQVCESVLEHLNLKNNSSQRWTQKKLIEAKKKSQK